MPHTGKTINSHAILIIFLSMLAQVYGEREICVNGTFNRLDKKHNWIISNAECSTKEVIIVIRVEKVHFACDNKDVHGYMTISAFPAKKICRMTNGTCFIFTSTAVNRRQHLPVVENCNKDQYWTFADDFYSSINVSYGQIGTDTLLDETLELTYEVYELGSPETPIVLVFTIVLGCICLLLSVALILVIRSRKKLVEKQSRSPDIAFKRESVQPIPSPGPEVVVNQLYGMSRRDEMSPNYIQ